MPAVCDPARSTTPRRCPGWDIGGLFPNGNYTIFVGRDCAFGIFCHPWERSLCVFGEHAVAAFATRNRGVLTAVLRREGQPVTDGGLAARPGWQQHQWATSFPRFRHRAFAIPVAAFDLGRIFEWLQVRGGSYVMSHVAAWHYGWYVAFGCGCSWALLRSTKSIRGQESSVSVPPSGGIG